MGILAAHHHRIGLAGQADIVGITAPAAEQGGVLLARNRLSDGKLLDRQPVGDQFIRPVLHGLLQIHDGSIL